MSSGSRATEVNSHPRRIHVSRLANVLISRFGIYFKSCALVGFLEIVRNPSMSSIMLDSSILSMLRSPGHCKVFSSDKLRMGTVKYSLYSTSCGTMGYVESSVLLQ